MQILEALLIGGGIGVVSGLFGVGGGFLMVPLLNMMLQLPASIAVGSAACYALGPATTSVLARKPRQGFLELPLLLAGGLFCGVLLGSRTLVMLDADQPEGTAEYWVLLSYLILMTGITLLLTAEVTGWLPPARRGLTERLPVPPVVTIPGIEPDRYSLPILAGLGLTVGFLSGFLGMSGGLVLLPGLTWVLGLRMRDAATVTAGMVWIVSAQATVVHAWHGNVDIPIVGVLLLSGTSGAWAGARFGQILKGRSLRLGFIGVVIVSAGIVTARLFRLV